MNDLFDVILGLIGGLGIFIYGMHYMSDGLQRIAGHRLKNLLATLTKNRFYAVGMGLGLTALIQSSSATTVTVVGFVNAGLMELRQAIGVVMGANIGTTVTAWIIGINITKMAPLFVGLGCFLVIFLSSKKYNRIGQVILGFGFIFMGMIVMKEGVAPLKKHEFIAQSFQNFSQHPILAIAVGIFMTSILQSSSATIGLAIVLAQQGLIDLNGAVPLIIGDNIGTTITAQIAALKTTENARRTAMSHTLFNCMGALWLFPFIIGPQLYQKFIIAITPLEFTPANAGIFIANAHTCFNVANVILFLPFIGLLEKVSIKLVPQRAARRKPILRYLEPQFSDKPAIALEMVRLELKHMLEVAERGVDIAVMGVLASPPKPVEDPVAEIEELVDEMQLQITRYIINLSQTNLNPEESNQIPVLLHTVNDIERISDHALNISQATEHLARKNLVLKPQEQEDLIKVYEDLQAMFKLVSTSLTNHSEESVSDALELENRIDHAKRRLRSKNVDRLQQGETDYLTGMVFLDTVNNFEKIGDHLTNIAEAVLRSFHFSAEEESDDESIRESEDESDGVLSTP